MLRWLSFLSLENHRGNAMTIIPDETFILRRKPRKVRKMEYSRVSLRLSLESGIIPSFRKGRVFLKSSYPFDKMLWRSLKKYRNSGIPKSDRPEVTCGVTFRYSQGACSGTRSILEIGCEERKGPYSSRCPTNPSLTRYHLSLGCFQLGNSSTTKSVLDEVGARGRLRLKSHLKTLCWLAATCL